MTPMTEPEIRKKLTDVFVFSYLPKVKKELTRFMDESYSKQSMAETMSQIVGRPVGVELGVLHIAEPTNEIIDFLVNLYVQPETQREKKEIAC